MTILDAEILKLRFLFENKIDLCTGAWFLKKCVWAYVSVRSLHMSMCLISVCILSLSVCTCACFVEAYP